MIVFTVDLDNLEESDDSDFDLRFSKTDIYLSENIVGTIVEDVEFEEDTVLLRSMTTGKPSKFKCASIMSLVVPAVSEPIDTSLLDK